MGSTGNSYLGARLSFIAGVVKVSTFVCAHPTHRGGLRLHGDDLFGSAIRFRPPIDWGS